jgi:very-short-patch-repair endonuclease
MSGGGLVARYARTPDKTDRAKRLRSEASKTERRLWPSLRGSALGAPFRRQHPIGPYFADYCCAPLKIVVEVDGPDHDLTHDARRDAFMTGEGFLVMRFGLKDVVERLEGVVEAIGEAVGARLASDPLPTSPFQKEEY